MVRRDATQHSASMPSGQLGKVLALIHADIDRNLLSEESAFGCIFCGQIERLRSTLRIQIVAARCLAFERSRPASAQ